MTKLITVFIIAIVLYGGWYLFQYWEKVRDEKNQATAGAVVPDQLPGMPPGLEPTFNAAEQQGAKGLRDWLKQYGRSVQDPRKAWIELSYVVLVAREDTAEAKRVFAEVQKRVTPSSPVYERMKQLEKTFGQ